MSADAQDPERLKRYRGWSEALVSMSTFDAQVVQSSNKDERALADLVLSLALVFNDIRDVYMTFLLVDAGRPSGPPAQTTAWAQQGGVSTHVLRIQVGVIHEFLQLLKESEKILRSEQCMTLRNQLSREARDAWNDILVVAFGGQAKGDLARLLLLVRNKVAFHYDPKEIGRGFREAFIGTKSSREPLLSRGNDLSSSRFYFADAGAQQYMMSQAEIDDINSFFAGETALLSQIHHALFEFVTRFIQSRGGAWRSPATQ